MVTALIAAAVIALMTGRGSRPAVSHAGRTGTAAAPALLPSTVRTRIPLPFGQPGDMTILGSTAWISDWSASQIIGVNLAARRVTGTLQVGDQQDQPISMTSGAGSLWVLDFSGPLRRTDPVRTTCAEAGTAATALPLLFRRTGRAVQECAHQRASQTDRE